LKQNIRWIKRELKIPQVENEAEICDLTRSIAPLTELVATLDLIFQTHENH
jgi:hypothetical protein